MWRVPKSVDQQRGAPLGTWGTPHKPISRTPVDENRRLVTVVKSTSKKGVALLQLARSIETEGVLRTSTTCKHGWVDRKSASTVARHVRAELALKNVTGQSVKTQGRWPWRLGRIGQWKAAT